MSEVQVYKCDGQVPDRIISGKMIRCGALMESHEGVEIKGMIGEIGGIQPIFVSHETVHLCPRCFKALFKSIPGLDDWNKNNRS